MPIERKLVCGRCGTQEDISSEEDRTNDSSGWVHVTLPCRDCNPQQKDNQNA